MSKYTRSKRELVVELSEQFEALKASASSYDAGKYWEAKRLATSVHTLVSEGKNSISVLRQLEIKSRIQFLTSAQPPDEPGKQTIGILKGMCGIAQTSAGPVYYPVLDSAFYKRRVAFHCWWDEELFTNQSNYKISRKNIVFFLRSKDGGSHFDGSIPQSAYLSLKTGNDTGVLAFHGDLKTYNVADAIPINNGHFAIMRQISYEVIETLRPIIQGSLDYLK